MGAGYEIILDEKYIAAKRWIAIDTIVKMASDGIYGEPSSLPIDQAPSRSFVYVEIQTTSVTMQIERLARSCVPSNSNTLIKSTHDIAKLVQIDVPEMSRRH